MPKNWNRDPLGFLNFQSVAKLEKGRVDPLGKKFSKKVLQCRKQLKGGPFGLARYCMSRAKKENLFGSVPCTNRYNIKFCRPFGRTILVTSGVSKKNTDEKP